jgi:predicted DNA-binding transcriptional regulator YafY
MPRLTRLLQLALFFSSRRRMRAEDAAAQFKVSVRTVYRDIAALSEAGFPLVGTAGDGYHLTAGALVKPLAVTPPEAESLVLAARALMGHADAALAAHLQQALLKLEATLTVESMARVKRHYATVRMPGGGAAGPLSLLLEAIHQREVVRLSYDGVRRGETTARDVEPLGVVREGRFWLVVAWCRLRNDVRVFRSDRVRSATPLGETFTPRPGASFEELVRQHTEGRSN